MCKVSVALQTRIYVLENSHLAVNLPLSFKVVEVPREYAQEFYLLFTRLLKYQASLDLLRRKMLSKQFCKLLLGLRGEASETLEMLPIELLEGCVIEETA